MSQQDPNSALLLVLAEVKGQLSNITQIIQSNQAATNQRIDDLRHALEGRLGAHESRLSRLETNERATAMKSSDMGAISGMATSMMVEAIKAALR